MTGHVLKHLGETKLELGPLDKRDGNWRGGRDATGVLWLALDKVDSGTNTITGDVLRELETHVAVAEANLPRAVVLRSAKSGGFAAGADITSFDRMSDEGAAELLTQGHAVLDRLEKLACPTVCVVHGAALGAGFELALACDARIAVPGASFGFPEVKLGLHPGLGGTFRLPALIDPTEAMTMMLTGKTAHTDRALSLGIVDEVVEERHVAAAVHALIENGIERHEPGLKARALGFEQARTMMARQMRSRTEEKAPAEHYPAPHALIELWEEHGNDHDTMQRGEITSFANLLKTPSSKNLRRVFFLRQKLKETARGEDGIEHVHVIGAGAMGADIAAVAAIKGKTVTLSDLAMDTLGRAVKQAEKICHDKHLSPAETRDVLDRLMPDPRRYGIARADLVIEAASEQVEVKEKIYADLGGRMKPDAILASNTSSLALDRLAKAAPNPSHFAGLHFFNPVARVDLVEVIRSTDTNSDTLTRLAAFCGAIGKLPVMLSDHPGFVVNRILTTYMLEAMVLMDEGVPKEVIDSAALRFGMPMGPVTLADQVGLDVGLKVAESLHERLEAPMPAISNDLREKVAAGNLGRKTGRGFYDWSEGTPQVQTDGRAAPDLTDRLVLPMLNAGVEVLRHDVAADADAIDAAMIFATGWAPFRGGPLHYARTRGTKAVTERLRELAEAHGPRFAPDDGWHGFS